jgi:chromosome condensin MukBEF ATPase and DNA-binding subunit MukB
MGERVESATLKPLMVVGTYQHGKVLASQIGRSNFMTLGNIEAGALRGQDRPLVWDNHAIALLATYSAQEIERAERERLEAIAAAERVRVDLTATRRELKAVEKKRDELAAELATMRANAAKATFTKKRGKRA